MPLLFPPRFGGTPFCFPLSLPVDSPMRAVELSLGNLPFSNRYPVPPPSRASSFPSRSSTGHKAERQHFAMVGQCIVSPLPLPLSTSPSFYLFVRASFLALSYFFRVITCLDPLAAGVPSPLPVSEISVPGIDHFLEDFFFFESVIGRLLFPFPTPRPMSLKGSDN